MPSDKDVTASLTALKSLGSPRVWSMLVSIFGDLAQEQNDRIEGPLLTRLTDSMAIKREAVRVALYRLRNDNWITSVKSGRTASHALTAEGLRLRNGAAPLIYNPLSAFEDAWVMAVLQAGESTTKARLIEAGFVAMNPRVYVAHNGVDCPADALITTGISAPDWAQGQLIDDDLTQQFSKLLTVLCEVSLRLPDIAHMSATDIAVLRCLIVHNWRRLVLRHPFLPPSLVGADWPGHMCRMEVVKLLDRLKRPALEDLMADERRRAS